MHRIPRPASSQQDARNPRVSDADILRLPPMAAASTGQGFQTKQEATGNGSEWVSFLLTLPVCCIQKN